MPPRSHLGEVTV